MTRSRATATPSHAATVAAAGQAQQPYILVVDDDPGIRAFVQLTLQGEGYNVATAANGREALSRVAQRTPDVVFLDLAMPVMTGWQFHDCLRASGIMSPVVYMSAGYAAAEEAARHGAEGHLAKPFELEDLLRVAARFAPLPPRTDASPR
jgi:two-component system chemotaxis response regulator CheY